VSPKNKGKFGKGKNTDIPDTDEFISGVDRILRALKPHALRIGIFFGVVAVIVVSFTVWKWWGQRKAAAATTLYAEAVALAQVPVSKDPPDDLDKRPPDPRDLPTHFATRTDRAKAVLSKVDELDSEYGSTGPSKQADLIAADALYELGKYAEAAERYRTYIDHGGPEDLVVTAREGLAYALEGQAMAEKEAAAREAALEKSLAAFEAMQPKSDGARRDEALFHQARVLASLGRTDDAVKRFEQILADHPSSPLKEDVELRLLALRAGPNK
jgi:tetratricopeptide (TPR) repeat protein